MKAKDFDQKFDAGEDLTPYLDLSKAKRIGAERQSISIDLPVWMLERINQEASRLGVTPQESSKPPWRNILPSVNPNQRSLNPRSSGL